MVATCCRIAAPVGVTPQPRGRAGAFFAVQCDVSKVARGVVAFRATSSGETSVETPEFVKAVQDAWDEVEDKYAVSAIGVAGIVALWTAGGAIKAIDKLPLLPGVLEIVGIGYTGWFTYRNLIFQSDREALFSKIESTYREIIGNTKRSNWAVESRSTLGTSISDGVSSKLEISSTAVNLSKAKKFIWHIGTFGFRWQSP